MDLSCSLAWSDYPCGFYTTRVKATRSKNTAFTSGIFAARCLVTICDALRLCRVTPIHFNKTNNSPKNIIETAIANPDFSTLVTAIKAADLVDTLSGAGPFTVFAPNNAAFAKIPHDALQKILDDKAKLIKVLTYHVVPGKVMSKDVGTMSEAKTVQGGMIKINTTSGVAINDSKVTTADIECSNGVIHVIDTVLMPA